MAARITRTLCPQIDLPMTATALVNFRENAFWAYDVPGSIFLWHLIQSAEELIANEPKPWLSKMIRKWRIAAAITEMACYTDDEWTTHQIDLIVKLSRQAIMAIRQHGDFSASDVETWPLIDNERLSARGHDPIPSEPVARLRQDRPRVSDRPDTDIVAIGETSGLQYVRITVDMADRLAELELTSFPTADPADLYDANELATLARGGIYPLAIGRASRTSRKPPLVLHP